MSEAMARKAAAVEASLLSAVLYGGDLDEVRTIVDRDMFGREAHRAVWDAICTVHDDRRTPDPMSVVDQLLTAGKLDVAGGAVAIHELHGQVVGAHATHYAREVAQVAWRRQAVELAAKLHRAASDPTVDPAAAVADARDLFDRPPASDELQAFVGEAIRDIPPPAWLVDGHVQEGLSLIYGPYESGKSMLAVDIAMCVAHGRPWWGHETVKMPVLYLAAEGVAGVAQRMAGWADHNRTSLDGLVLCGEPINLHRARDVTRLDALVRRHGAGLVVADTYARMTAGGNENDAGEAGEAVEHLDRLMFRRGCSVVAVHHSGKDREDPRGSTALPAAVESGIRVSRDSRRPVFSIYPGKMKNAPDFPERTFRIIPSHGSVVLEQVGRNLTPGEVDRRRVEALARIRAGDVTRLVAERDFGVEVVAQLLVHPEVEEGFDGGGRPVLRVANGRTPV